MKTAERITEDEMVEILEDIARNSNNASARIAAIRVLRELGGNTASAEDGFAALDELAPRRGFRVKNSA